MKIEDLQETAQLAHLTMDERELAGAFPAFEEMLGFFAAMQSADADADAFPEETGVSRSAVASEHFRQDNPDNPALSLPLNGSLLDNAGERDGNFVVMPHVL
ncbi:MAG: aspartyl/glutamyl-tRNA amidotransferase subunit C [Spirochaetaceae bacterium]|jgi:aspartyl-tRNA(Asn)/glutamyl-tRNA(Gln) amidotransferase subunit C|nr:aspartyl/glutamyl-tRNA amidotransferase subunit C [Spirochaetaceae bacterium]